MNKLLVNTPSRVISLLPAARTDLKVLLELLPELLSYWIGYGFGVGELVANDNCWKLMQEIVNLLPHEANAAMRGFDLNEIGNDYQQLESLFLCRGKSVIPSQVHGYNVLTFDEEQFIGGAIVELHLFSPKGLMVDARLAYYNRETTASEASQAIAAAEANQPVLEDKAQ